MMESGRESQDIANDKLLLAPKLNYWWYSEEFSPCLTEKQSKKDNY